MREARDEVSCDRLGALLVVQQVGEEADLIEKTVLVQGVFLLRDLVLFERLPWLFEEAKTIAEIGPDIWIIGAARDRVLVMLDRVRPVLPIIVPVSQRARGLGGCELRNIRRLSAAATGAG